MRGFSPPNRAQGSARNSANANGRPCHHRRTRAMHFECVSPLQVEDQTDGVRWLISQGPPARLPARRRQGVVAHSTPSADRCGVGGGFAGLIDGRRVGIYGWSYGGYLAAMALMRMPDVVHFAVAGAAQPSATRRRRAGSWRRCGRSAWAEGARGMALHVLTTLYTAQGCCSLAVLARWCDAWVPLSALKAYWRRCTGELMGRLRHALH